MLRKYLSWRSIRPSKPRKSAMREAVAAVTVRKSRAGGRPRRGHARFCRDLSSVFFDCISLGNGVSKVFLMVHMHKRRRYEWDCWFGSRREARAGSSAVMSMNHWSFPGLRFRDCIASFNRVSSLPVWSCALSMTLKRQRDLLLLRLAGLLHPRRHLPPPSFPSRSRTDSKVPLHWQIRFQFR